MNSSKDLIPYRKGNLWGYCDREGKVILEPSFLYLTFFNCGYSFYGELIKKEDSGLGSDYVALGVMDSNFHPIIPAKELNFVLPRGKYNFSNFRERIWWGVLYSFFPAKELLHDSLLDINKFGFVDQIIRVNKEIILGFRYNYKLFIKLLNNSGEEVDPLLFPIKVEEKIGKQLNLWSLFHGVLAINNKYGYIDHFGKLIVPFIYDFISKFKKGFASIKLNDKYSLVDEDGKIIFHFVYDEIIFCFIEGRWHLRDCQCWFYLVSDNDGIRLFSINSFMDSIKVKTEKKRVMDRDFTFYGLENYHGSEIFPVVLTEMPKIYDSVSVIKFNSYYGVIDSIGGFLIPNRFFSLQPLRYDNFLFFDGNDYGVITTDLKRILNLNLYKYLKDVYESSFIDSKYQIKAYYENEILECYLLANNGDEYLIGYASYSGELYFQGELEVNWEPPYESYDDYDEYGHESLDDYDDYGSNSGNP